VLTHVLRQAALRRLMELGVRSEQAEVLVSSKPRLGDRWLAYLALAPVSVIDDLIRGDWRGQAILRPRVTTRSEPLPLIMTLTA
jgi:hypothetical protein